MMTRKRADSPNPFAEFVLKGIVKTDALIEASHSKPKARTKYGFSPYLGCRITNRIHGGSVPGKVCVNMRNPIKKGREFYWVAPSNVWVYVGYPKGRRGRHLVNLTEYRPWVKVND